MAYEHHQYHDAERQIAHRENQTKQHEGVEEMRHFVKDVADDLSFKAALQGESGYLTRIGEMDNANKKVKFTASMLVQSPLIKKLIPNYIIEENHAAFIVAVAEWLIDQEEDLRQVE